MTAAFPALDGTAVYWLIAFAVVFALFALQHWRTLWARVPRGAPALLAASTICAVAVFAKIASEVQEHETSELDRAVSLAVHRLDSPALDGATKLLSFLGSFPVTAAVVVAGVLWCLRRGDKRRAILLTAVSVVAELSNLVLKESFQRTRPSLFQEIATLHSYSFPSGHAMGSAAVYGALSVVVARARPRWAFRAFVLASALVLLIGLSRVYLGVHWITDVLAGWAAGLAVVLIGTFLIDRKEAS